ncbi:MAG TPA: ABC transporter permease [Polyangiaceae bacterium]|jgi:putative ABC transport system permease protein
MLFALIAEAAKALLRHKARSALNVLGVAIGIAAVAWVVAIGQSAAARAQAQLAALGDNLVWVEAGSRSANGVRSGTDGMRNLTLDDATAIARDVPSIRFVSPNVDGTVVVQWQTKNWTTRFRGVAPDYEDIKRWDMASGERFTDDDVDRATNVCVLGATVRAQLFGSGDAVGQTIRITGQPFKVVGVMAPKGQSATGRDQDDELHVPYTTAMKKLRGGGETWLDDILCSASSSASMSSSIAEIDALLRQRHHLGVDDDDDFNIRHPEELIQAQMRAADTLETLLVSIASVALLVGGIGLMNVMLASVVERTREIGVRLAVGAPPWAIQAQFLVEALMLACVGGLVGVGASVAGTSLLSRTLDWSLAIPPQAIGVSVVFSLSIGVTFGYLPARRAARVDPIEALRQE